MCHPTVNCGAVHCGAKCCHNRVRQQPACLLWHGLQEENKPSNLNGRIVPGTARSSTETTRFRSRLALGASFCGGVRVSCHFHLFHFSTVTRAHLNGSHQRGFCECTQDDWWLLYLLSAFLVLSLLALTSLLNMMDTLIIFNSTAVNMTHIWGSLASSVYESVYFTFLCSWWTFFFFFLTSC